jgi:hypothetical protein
VGPHPGDGFAYLRPTAFLADKLPQYKTVLTLQQAVQQFSFARSRQGGDISRGIQQSHMLAPGLK